MIRGSISVKGRLAQVLWRERFALSECHSFLTPFTRLLRGHQMSLVALAHLFVTLTRRALGKKLQS